jgi:hypothetical protein
MRVSQKGTLFYFLDYVHLASPKANEAKKRSPEKTTLPSLSARYTGHNGATKQGKVRTFSGLPSLILKA